MNGNKERIIEELVREAERLRNISMARGQTLAFVYYQGFIDGLAELSVELENKNKQAGIEIE